MNPIENLSIKQLNRLFDCIEKKFKLTKEKDGRIACDYRDGYPKYNELLHYISENKDALKEKYQFTHNMNYEGWARYIIKNRISELEDNSMRVQRSRRLGYKMPKEVIYVGRGTKWGNPFKLENGNILEQTKDGWKAFKLGNENTVEDVIALFRDLVIDINSHKVNHETREKFQYMYYNLQNLKGKRLACWCCIESPCHADVLIELANK